MNEIKMSIICTIQQLSKSYSFEFLEKLKYEDLEKIRDLALINYNKRVKK